MVFKITHSSNTLEPSFIVLVVMSVKNFRHAYLSNFIIVDIIIAGNIFFPKAFEDHVSLIAFYNAKVRIIRGYVLQGLLIIANTNPY